MKLLEANRLEDTMLIVLAGNRRASADEPLHLRASKGLGDDLAEPFHPFDEESEILSSYCFSKILPLPPPINSQVLPLKINSWECLTD